MTEENLPKILPSDFKPYWKQDVSIDDYHRDRTFISSTSIRLFLESPRHFYWFFVKGRDIKTSESMDFGNLAHVCILEPKKFREKYKVMPDFESFDAKGNPSESKNTSYYKNKVAEWKAAQPPDAILCTKDDYEKLEHMLESILSHKAARLLLKDGLPEVSGYYRDPVTGIGCRIRPDFLKYSMMAMSDLKTCQTPKYGPFRRQVEMLNYDAQIAQYSEGFFQIEGNRLVTSNFIAIQSTAPYDTCVWVADDALLEIGYKKYRFALNGIRHCMETGVWPGYQLDGLAQNMGPSQYAMEVATYE